MTNYFKRVGILRACCFCAGMAAVQSQGALLNTGYDPSSPLFADFTSSGLQVSYSYDSGSGVGLFTAVSSSDPSAVNDYTSGPASAGTHGTADATGFSGFYTLTAYVEDIGGVWQVIDNGTTERSTLSIYGALPGVTSGSGDLLLSADLKTGVNTFGYDTPDKNEFDFLFTVTGGNGAIAADFFGVGTGQGGVIVNPNAYNSADPYTGSLTQGFDNLGGGVANSFVPEPAAYPLGAALAAVAGFAVCNRKARKG